MQAATPPPFPIFESFAKGLRLMGQHARLLMVLSVFPLALTMATMIFLRVTGDDTALFWQPIIQLPATFVTGLQCALILRFLLLSEFPLVADAEARSERNRLAFHAALAYAAVNYLVTGGYVALLKLRAFLIVNPAESAPYAPLLLLALVVLVWAMRWFWLHVPLALGWQVKGFYERIGNWGGSLRIFALFALCSLMLNFITSFARLAIASVGGKNGYTAAFDDAALSVGTLLLAVLFTTATAAAVKSLEVVRRV